MTTYNFIIIYPDLQFFSLIESNTNMLRIESSAGENLGEISLQYPFRSSTSSNNILAYRPRYSDYHSSGLAAIFVNIKKVFTCLALLDTSFSPSCTIITHEDNGFRNGRPYIELGDSGDDVRVFGSNTPTYGFALHDCPEVNTPCVTPQLNVTVMCFLPRSVCP